MSRINEIQERQKHRKANELDRPRYHALIADIDYLLSQLKDGGAESPTWCPHQQHVFGNWQPAAIPWRFERICSKCGFAEKSNAERGKDFRPECATAPTETSARCGEWRCVECRHNNVNRNNGFCIEWIDRKQRRCGCKCVFPTSTEQAGEPTLEDLAIEAARYLESLGDRQAEMTAFALRENVRNGSEKRKIAAMFPEFGWPDRLLFSEAIAEQLVQMTRIVAAPATPVAQPACPHCNRQDCVCSDFDVLPDMGAKG